jgi:phosphoglycolate phosphatase-like HAD superfamily hydrolase
MNPADRLTSLNKSHDFIVGIDSDGCVFDSMEIKHKECFVPQYIKHFKLQAASKYARETWDFVNLYSKTRGTNRWPALLRSLELLERRRVVKARGVKFPFTAAVRAFVNNGKYPMSNAGLKAYAAENGADPALDVMHAWTHAVNAMVEDIVEGVPPFRFVRESLARLQSKADMIVVSQTPTEALEREWAEHSIDGYVQLIAGQEMGTKTEHLKLAAAGKYPNEKILMIGDAPGDRNAAKANGALFQPINPGHEEDSWQRFFEEGIDKFLGSTFAGEYEARLIDEFERHLPENPPW